MPSEERKPTEGQRVCPKCGGEMRFHESWVEEDGVEYRAPENDRWYCVHTASCGHEEKVRP